LIFKKVLFSFALLSSTSEARHLLNDRQQPVLSGSFGFPHTLPGLPRGHYVSSVELIFVVVVIVFCFFFSFYFTVAE